MLAGAEDAALPPAQERSTAAVIMHQRFTDLVCRSKQAAEHT